MRNVLITGVTGGIGRAVAKRLLSTGWMEKLTPGDTRHGRCDFS